MENSNKNLNNIDDVKKSDLNNIDEIKKPDIEFANVPTNGINAPDLHILSVRKTKCRNCRQLVQPKGEICPNCGHYLFENQHDYEPINPKTAKKIRWGLGAALLVLFAALVYFGVFTLDACSETASKFLH